MEREKNMERKMGTPPKQESEGMATPEKQPTLPAQGTRKREGAHPPTLRGERKSYEVEDTDGEADTGQDGQDGKE